MIHRNTTCSEPHAHGPAIAAQEGAHRAASSASSPNSASSKGAANPITAIGTDNAPDPAGMPRDATHECVGLLAASATHELQNALAVIRESAGLMQDLVSLCDEGLPHRERLCTMLALIQEQVARGGDLAWNLNRLAHAWEEEDGEERDLGAVIEEFVALARRWCALRGLGLTRAEGPRVRMAAPGLALRTGLLRAVQCCLDRLGNDAGGWQLALRPATHDGQPGVRLELTPPAATDDTGQADRNALRDDLAQDFLSCGVVARQATETPCCFFLPCSSCSAQ